MLSEPPFDAPGWYPPSLLQLNHLERGDRLVLLLGQFNASAQTERLYDQPNVQVYYHPDSDDWIAPNIRRMESTLTGASASTAVWADDASGIQAIVIAYTHGDGVWSSIELTQNGSTWTGDFPASAGTVFFVQAVDGAGNVSVLDNDGLYYRPGEASAPATTVTLQQGSDGYTGTDDTHIFMYAPAANYCTEGSLQVGYKQQYAALVRFDVNSIPTDSLVIHADLQVYAVGWGGPDTGMSIAAHYITRTMSACQATWSQAQNGNNWATAGCSDPLRDRRETAESSVATSGMGKWYSFDLTEVVQGWVSGGLANNGILLRASPGTSTAELYFASAQHGNLTLRPKLVVTYGRGGTAVPTPPPITVVTIQKGTYGDSADTYMYRFAPNTNYSSESLLKVGYKQLFAGLLRFDLSPIPPGATIDSAALEVYAAGWGGADITIGTYAISRTVTISEATWNEAQTETRWGGAGCSHTRADRRSNPESVLTTSGPLRWYRFDLTALVREWFSGALPNNGVLLRQDVYALFAMFFASSEHTDVELRPRLVVRYH